MEALPSWPYHLPKALSPNTITLRFQHKDLEGTHIQTIAKGIVYSGIGLVWNGEVRGGGYREAPEGTEDSQGLGTGLETKNRSWESMAHKSNLGHCLSYWNMVISLGMVNGCFHDTQAESVNWDRPLRSTEPKIFTLQPFTQNTWPTLH